MDWIMDFPGHFEQIFQQLNYQRLHGQLCDCVIVVGNRHFKAHRSVLAACSTHFRALFTVAEGDQTMNMIQLDSEVVTAEAFAALIDMMYTSTLMLGESNVMDVLLAASHLHLNSVVKACKHYLTTRTLPMSPPSDRVQEQNARMQRSFMLQQLGLSIVSSALNSTQSTEEQTNSMSSSVRSNIEQQCFSNTLHKRKQSSEERARQRIRPSMDDSIMSDVTPESAQTVVHSRDEFFSPDSLKIVDNSKTDGVSNQEDNTVMFDQSFGAQEDPQVPSQSDNSGELFLKCLWHRRRLKLKLVLIKTPLPKNNFQCENPEDEVSDVTSQAEGSESVEVEGGGVIAEKIELSPESSDRSFSDPQSSTDRVGDIHIMEVGNNIEHKSTFSISNFLNKSRASSFGASQNHEDNIPNTTSDCRMDGDASYLISPESGPANSHSSASVSHVENPFNESTDSDFVRPMQDVMGLPCVQTSGYRTAEQFGMDFPRSGLGLHSLSRAISEFYEPLAAQGLDCINQGFDGLVLLGIFLGMIFRNRIMDFPGHFEQIFQQLNYQRLHGQLCDCVIVVGNRHFKAHRSVLAACSTHFRALFTVAEGDQTMNMIQLDSEVVTAEAFAALIDMMYTSTLMLERAMLWMCCWQLLTSI
ncbi:putative Zinc finger and BTB domain-containing protein [Naja naja]|nr:putative Zinc finger and BTB domain-containing protein [Naja naja]